jgi:hypothetical protein
MISPAFCFVPEIIFHDTLHEPAKAAISLSITSSECHWSVNYASMRIAAGIMGEQNFRVLFELPTRYLVKECLMVSVCFTNP